MIFKYCLTFYNIHAHHELVYFDSIQGVDFL